MSEAADKAIVEVTKAINKIINNIVVAYELEDAERETVIDSGFSVITEYTREIAIVDDEATNEIANNPLQEKEIVDRRNEIFLNIISEVELLEATIIYDPLNTAFIEENEEEDDYCEGDVSLSSLLNESDVVYFHYLLLEVEIPPLGYVGSSTIPHDYYDAGYYGHRVDLLGMKGNDYI